MSPQTSNLKISVQEQEAWSRHLSITVPADRVRRTRDAVTERIARNARMPGFRKGKLPTRVIEQRFGPSIEQETIDQTIQEAYREALETQGFAPISQGKVEKIEYRPGTDLTFEVDLEVQPELRIDNVSGFNLSRSAVAVTDEEVEGVLERLREERANWETVEGESVKPEAGQQVLVEITTLGEGGEAAGAPSSERFVIGEGNAIPDLEAAISGLAVGEEGDFTVRFPEEAKRDDEMKLHIKLEDVQRKVLPDADDEFAKAVGGGEFEDAAGLRARIRSDLEKDAEQRSENEVRQQLVDRILEANPFSVPGSMVERYLDYMTGHSHAGGHDHQHTPEEEERLETIRQTLRPQAEWGLKRTLLVEHLAEREGLAATQDEIDAKVEALAAQNGRTPSEVWLQLEKSGQLEMLEREITQDKVFTFLLGQSTVA